MNNTIKVDIAIIGAGSAGLSLAAGAAQLGLKVALIEKAKMGGDCLNYGCVPSKSFLSAAKKVWRNRQNEFLKTEKAELNFEKVMAHVQQVINTIAPNDSQERFEGLGVKLIKAKAEFIDRKTLKAGEDLIKAKKMVIATGSKPLIPEITGLEKIKYYTNESIFSIKHLPEHLIILGAGPMGAELAQAFCFLGSKVSLVSRDTLLAREDKECTTVLREQLQKNGVILYELTKIESIMKSGSNVTVNFIDNSSIEGSELLIATGRHVDLTELKLDKAGVSYSEYGVDVDKRLRTNVKNIYAMGDAIGEFQYTHAANYDAGILLKNLCFKIPAKVNYNAMPRVTYTYPELAHVGMATDGVNEKKYQLSILDFSENDRAQCESLTIGKIRVVTDKKGYIKGVSMIAANAGELILPWIMAIRENKSLRSFTDVTVPYPTLSESSKAVAAQFYKPKLFSRPVKTIVKLLSKVV